MSPKPVARGRQILIADDEPNIVAALEYLLERNGYEVRVARNGNEALKSIELHRPDLVLLDVMMPLCSGYEVCRRMRENEDWWHIKVIMLSAYSDDAFVKQVTELGAAGFLLKQTSSDVLATAIREVQKGNTFFSPAIAKRLQRRDQKSLDRGEQSKPKGNYLSSREVEVLQLIAEGHPNKQIAAELGVGFKTVDNHRQRLMGKLNIHDVAGLTRYAIAEGIIKSNPGATAG